MTMHKPSRRVGPWWRGFVWVAAACLAGASGAATAAMSEIEEDHTLSMAFQTPHTAWAKPYALGPTRVLVFINGRGTLPREVIELKQRFDLDAASVYWIRVIDTTRERWLHGEVGIKRMVRLLGRRWDCFVMYQVPLTSLPDEAQYKLLTQVCSGAGLVMVGANDRRVIKKKNRIQPVPAFLAQGTPFVGLPFVQEAFLKDVAPAKRTNASAVPRLLDAYRVKKGRALVMCRRPNLGDDVGWHTQYEYWAQCLGRAILWAGNKQPHMTLAVTVNHPRCELSRLGEVKVKAQWKDATPPARPVQVRLTLRRLDGWTTVLKSLEGASTHGTIEHAVTLSSTGRVSLRAGRYFVDAIVRTGKGVEAWGTATFELTSDRGVHAVELTQPSAEIGGTLAGTVTLCGNAAPGDAARVELVDPHGRIIARADLPARYGPVPFSFDVTPWMPMLVRVDGKLIARGREIQSKHAWFHVTQRHRGRFNSLIWDYPHGTLAPWAERALATYGCTLQLCGGNPPNFVAANGLAWVPYTIHINNKLDANGIMNGGCWNDPKVVTPRVKKLAEKYTPARRHGVFVYSLGDEIATRGSCLSTHCLKAYRAYLKKTYRAVGAMNASWGSSYKRFDDVVLLDPKDNDGAEAKRRSLYARWYDRQAFQCANICRYYKRFGDAYRSIDPQSRTGYEGAGRLDRGDDYDLIVRTNQFWSPYPGLGDEVIRSIAPRDFPRSNWMGYVKTADPLTWKYWRMVTRGCDAVWWWRWDALGRFHGFLAPHLAPFEATQEMLSDTQVVRDGLGTLLIRSKRLDDGVAILYSHPSAYATKVEGGRTYGSYAAMHEFWCRTLRELRVEFRYVTDRMLRLGEFKAGSAKVLILAQAEAIGDKDAAAIRRFVQAGGTVIADVRPGIYTGRCKPRASSVLADLFGIKPTKPASAKRATATITGPFGNTTLERMQCDPSVQLAGGKAHGTAGKIPVAIVHRAGKGQAVLLNFSLSAFPALWTPSAPESAAEFLSRLLASAGVRPVFVVQDLQGKRFRDLEVTRWQNRGIQIVSLFRKAGTPQQARVQMPGAWHVYNLRTRQHTAPARSITVAVPPNRATFLVMTPKPVPKVTLRLSAVAVQRGGVLRLTAAVPGADGLHAVRLRVQTPDRTPAPWLDRELMVDVKGTPCDLPVALNDPRGTWRVEATDVYTRATYHTEYTAK